MYSMYHMYITWHHKGVTTLKAVLTCDLLRQTSFFSGYRFLNKEQIICKEGFSLYLLKISYAVYTEPDLSMVILQDISSCTSAATEFNSPLLTQVALVYLATILNTPYRLSSHGHPKISQWFTQKMPFGLQYLISFSTTKMKSVLNQN